MCIGSCRCLSSWSCLWHYIFPTSSCFGILFKKPMTVCHRLYDQYSPLLIFVALLTHKVRASVGDVLVRFSSGLSWPLNRMLWTSCLMWHVYQLILSQSLRSSWVGNSFGKSLWAFTTWKFEQHWPHLYFSLASWYKLYFFRTGWQGAKNVLATLNFGKPLGI